MRKNLYMTSLIILILIFSISFVSASEIDSNDTQMASNPTDYYVDLGGDDNNEGYLNSPFYSINKAVSVCGHSDTVTIHLCEGVFEGENNTMITINKAHLSRGGSITIQGAGADKTFIDGSYAYYIFDVKSDSVVTLKDLSIVDCKSVTGGAITNTGTLTLLDCSFNNNHAIRYGGAVYSGDTGILTVKDSTFNNNTAKEGGAIFSQKSDLKIDSSRFTNNHVEISDSTTAWGGAVYVGAYYKSVPSVVNSVFINNSAVSKFYREDWNPASGGSIYMQRCNLNNVSFINSKTEGLSAQGGSYYFDSKYMNSLINILRINSTVNGVLEPNIYPSNYNGEYLVNISAYVSPDGSDVNGDGSKSNPFATIAHVIDVYDGKAYNLEINLLDGTYKGSGNTNLDLGSSMNIKIIGSNAILDGENTNALLNISTSVIGFSYELVNLTITNFKCQRISNERDENIGIIHILYSDMLIDNCSFIDNSGIIITNMYGSNLVVNNSLFLNTDCGVLHTYDAYSRIYNTLISNTKIDYIKSVFEIYQNLLDDCELVTDNVSVLNSNGQGYIYRLHAANCDILNSNIINTSCSKDIVASYNPDVNIHNSRFINGSGFTNEMNWNVTSSEFTGNNNLDFEGSLNFNAISLIDNVGTVRFNGNAINIAESGIYDNINVQTVSNNKINLNNNYWAGLNPSQLIKSNYDVLPETWIVRSLSAENLFNGSFKVKLNYRLNNNQEYDITNVPINDVDFILNCNSASIEGTLAKSGFECVCDVGEDDLNVNVYFKDNINLTLFAQNLHKSESRISLSTNSCDIGDKLDISIDVVDLKTKKSIDEGNLNLYLNDELIAIYTLNGNTLTKTINVNGTKCLNNISVKYFGNVNFTDSQDYELFLIKSLPLDTVLSGDDLVKYYKNDSRYEVLLKDVLGNALANRDIEFIINSVPYIRKTNENGVASIAINLRPGSYEINARFNGDDSFNLSSTSNNIMVLSTLNGNNLTKYFRNASQYYIQVLDGKGNPVTNRNVTMNINGVFYNRLTNDKGIARLNINLNPGTYILTAYHPDTGLEYSNIITVLSRIETTDIGMFYKDGTGFDALLLDEKGNVLVNTNVTFNINGVFYTRSSDSNGIAHLNINLHPGRYIITTYLGDSVAGNTINIDAMPVAILSSNVNIEQGKYYQVRFYDAKGSPIVSQEVAIKVNENLNLVRTDGEGIASLKMDFEPGIYHIEAGLTSGNYESKSVLTDVRVFKGGE